MRTRRIGWLAWMLWVLALLGLATVVWLDHLLRLAGRPELAWSQDGPAPYVVAAVSAATVGAVLASRRPSHPVGWLLLGLGLSMQVHGVAQEYVADGLVGRPGALPAAGYLIGVLPRHCGPLAVVRQLCPAVDSDRAAALAPLVVVGQADRGRSGGVPAGIGG